MLSLPLLKCIHWDCFSLFMPPSMATCWAGNHIMITAKSLVMFWEEHGLNIEEGSGFGAALTVRIEAEANFFGDIFRHDVVHLGAIASFFCPDTLVEAVLVTDGDLRFWRIPFSRSPTWRKALYALICKHGHLFAFEVDTRFGKTRLAWRRWPPRGTRAREAAAELHSQAAEWAGVQPDNTQALLERSFQMDP